MSIIKQIFSTCNPILKDHIHSYWTMNGDEEQDEINIIETVCNNYTTELMAPGGFPTMVFHLTKICCYYDNMIKKRCYGIIGGQLERHFNVSYKFKGDVIGINFLPYGLYNLLGIKPIEIRNKIIPIESIFDKNEVCNLMQKIQSTDSIEDIISFIESFLLKYKHTHIKYQLYFDNFVDKIIEANGIVELGSLLNNTTLLRSFQRYFHEVIGTSPKQFCLLNKHIYVLKNIFKHPDKSISNIITDCEYYDFSHFNKEFKRFTNMGIKQYLELNNELTRAMYT